MQMHLRQMTTTDLENTKGLCRNNLKNGICENHFLKHQFSSGKKSRLKPGVSPSINIISETDKYDHAVKSNVKKINKESVDDLFELLITIDQNEPSQVVSLPSVANRCLVCNSSKEIVFMDEIKFNYDDKNLLEYVTDILDIANNNFIKSNLICRTCYDAIETIIKLKRNIADIVFNLQSNYCKTSESQENANDVESEFCPESKLSVCEGEEMIIPNETTGICFNENINSISSTTQNLKWQRTGNNHCPKCDRLLTSKGRLKMHLYKFHGIGQSKKLTHKCKLCDRAFASRNGLNYHELTFHKNTDTMYICEICAKSFNYQVQYNNHKIFAHGGRKVMCEMCGKRFVTVAKLNYHINSIHLKVESWSCEPCDKKFLTNSAFRHHNLVKHHCKLYECSYCSMKFKKSSSLNRHLRIHKIYVCQKCKMKFEDSALYSSHMFKEHNVTFSKKMKANLGLTEVRKPESSIAKSVPDIQENKSIPNVVINDILITGTSNTFDNSLSHPYMFLTNKDKCKPFSLNESSNDLTCVEEIPFENSLEIEAVVQESISRNDLLSSITDSDQSENGNDLVPTLLEQSEQHLAIDLSNSVTDVCSIKQILPSNSIPAIKVIHDISNGNSLVNIVAEVELGVDEKPEEWQLPNPLEDGQGEHSIG